MVEYAVVTGIFLSLVIMLSLFLYTFREYGGRILELVASEFP